MEKSDSIRATPILFLIAFSIILISGDFVFDLPSFRDTTPPVVDVWYGPNQSFGKAGLSQRWVNVLGNASDPESGVSMLRYMLNDGPMVPMRMGPDERRLEKPGDFNVELEPAQLHDGDNQLLIEAINGRGLQTVTVVMLNYHHNVLSLPYTIDWATVRNAQDVLQIVDGKWKWDAGGIRPVELGYDRFLTVGDASWKNYEVTVPVTVHGFDPSAFHRKKSGEHAGISVDLRWIGHSDYPVKCFPPHCGWDPVGDFNKYFFKPDGNDFLGLKVKEKEDSFPTISYKFLAGHTYMFRAQVETTAEGNRYRMKVWEPSVQPEPGDWMFDRIAAPGPPPEGNPDHGAFALVAHHTDVTFGNISVKPLPTGVVK